MALKLYNSMTRKKEAIKPIKTGKLNLFVCGPTVYDYSHIGHARTYVAFDLIVKYLRSKGFNVYYLQNITDIDDKIIVRSIETKQDPSVLAEKFAAAYFKDMEALGVDSVDKYAFATHYIPQIIKQVQTLVKKKYAYKIEDGYYFDLSKFKDYGKLSRRTALESEDAVSRIDESVNKRNKGDFALWKLSKKGEPSWDSPLGKGRPGWHIEDTAITEKEFGPQYDIHGGARDLIFPHHEAEIAQMESASGKSPLVRHWIHTGFLNVRGQKMSKSLGNFITIRDALKKWDVNLLKFFFLTSNYRSPIDFTEKNMENAQNSLSKITNTYYSLQELIKTSKGTESKMASVFRKYKKRFYEAMDDDFNTPKALVVLFDFTAELNKKVNQKTSSTDIKEFLKLLDEFAEVLTITFKQEDKVPKVILALVKKRESARKRKDWKTSDKLRADLKKKGYEVQDSPTGPRVRKIIS
jgi:cysteinyl-tRNA synthetase